MAGLRFACHVITWGGVQRDDPEGVMAAVKSAGWDAVEGFGAETPGDLCALALMAAKHGLHIINAGASTTEGKCRNNVTLGNGAAEIGAAWKRDFGGADASADDLARAAATLQPAIDHFRQYHLRPFHHAHLGTVIETTEDAAIVLDHAPGLELLLDTGHLLAAGSDPLETLRRFTGRIAHVHLKDTWVREPCTTDPRRGGYGEAWRFIELGEGSFSTDFGAILKGLEGSGYDGWISVEQDTSLQPAADCARQNREFLRALGY